METRFREHSLQIEKLINTALNQVRESIKDNSKQIRELSDNQHIQLVNLEQCQHNIKELQEESGKAIKLMESHTTQLRDLKLNKTDLLEFRVHLEGYKESNKDLIEFNEITRNKVLSCENYLEKYQPLFTQRQIEEVLRYVLTTAKQKYRLKKYSDLKNEFLTGKILADKGNPNLLTIA